MSRHASVYFREAPLSLTRLVLVWLLEQLIWLQNRRPALLVLWTVLLSVTGITQSMKYNSTGEFDSTKRLYIILKDIALHFYQQASILVPFSYTIFYFTDNWLGILAWSPLVPFYRAQYSQGLKDHIPSFYSQYRPYIVILYLHSKLCLRLYVAGWFCLSRIPLRNTSQR